MIEGPTGPLAIAARVLQPKTIQMLRASPFHSVGWAIADRWAMNSPEELKALEAEGMVPIFSRIVQQQRIEQEAFDRNPSALTTRAPMEILRENEIQTELTTPQPA